MKKKHKILFFILLLCFLEMGYAFLRTELKINGIANINDMRWNVYFNNLVINPNSVALSTGNTAASISTNKTEVTYAVTLKEPGDFYEFTVDAVNDGSMDAMIDTISSKMGGVEITTLPTYMEYSVTYDEGVELSPNQYLKAGETETYKVHIGFKKDIDVSDLTGQIESKSFSFSVAYVQADDHAFVRAKTFAEDDWDTILTNIQSDNSCGPYHLGDTKEISIGTYGTHTLRIANCSTPPECSTEGFSQTACGIVLEFADVITIYNLNVTNVSGWPASPLRTFVNNNIYNALPETLKDSIIDTMVVSGHAKNVVMDNFISEDKLYLLSIREIFNDTDNNPNNGANVWDTAYNNSRELDYYMNFNSPPAKSGASAYWWLRTPSNNSDDYYFVAFQGGFGSVYNTNFGISPAFRIG